MLNLKTELSRTCSLLTNGSNLRLIMNGAPRIKGSNRFFIHLNNLLPRAHQSSLRVPPLIQTTFLNNKSWISILTISYKCCKRIGTQIVPLWSSRRLQIDWVLKSMIWRLKLRVCKIRISQLLSKCIRWLNRQPSAECKVETLKDHLRTPETTNTSGVRCNRCQGTVYWTNESRVTSLCSFLKRNPCKTRAIKF